jgi:hypothetical protein
MREPTKLLVTETNTQLSDGRAEWGVAGAGARCKTPSIRRFSSKIHPRPPTARDPLALRVGVRQHGQPTPASVKSRLGSQRNNDVQQHGTKGEGGVGMAGRTFTSQ